MDQETPRRYVVTYRLPDYKKAYSSVCLDRHLMAYTAEDAVFQVQTLLSNMWTSGLTDSTVSDLKGVNHVEPYEKSVHGGWAHESMTDEERFKARAPRKEV
jgi:hypothetical protein